MLLSYNWLKEYLPINLSPQKLGEELTLLGLEVTEVKPVNHPIPGLTVGEVIKKWKHPNADRLNLTQIRHLMNGEEVVDQVVCGAANIDSGQKILLAKVGTELGPNFIIKKAKIRGEESCGMVCSCAELGKEENSEGIWVLPPDTSLETDPQKFLGKPDFLLDFDITSNRWDAMSVIGIVREIAILLHTSIDHKNKGSFATWETKMPSLDFSQLPPPDRIQVMIENPDDCYRYQGIDINDIQVTLSPDWLTDRLFLHGLRPIENVVDITNLILREYGQPIHAFDADKIGKVISIRLARPGETLILLDGKKIKLNPEDLVIADKNKPIALAGVMGGMETGVTTTTKNVFLETAVFNSRRIRQTMIRHQLSTDAGRYFQHGVDVVFSEEVIRIAANAIAHFGKGHIPTQPVDVFPTRDRFTSKSITLNLNFLYKTLGFKFPTSEIVEILKRLSFSAPPSLPPHWEGEELTVAIPHYRQDLEQEWDLVEEIARVYGYNRIPVTYPRITNGLGAIATSPQKKLDELQKEFRKLCFSLGFHEVLTYPFVENRFASQLELEEKNFLKPINPVWNDISLLRNSLLFGFLKTIQGNTEKKVSGFNRIFEMSKVFSPLTVEKSSAALQNNHKDAASWEHSHLGLAVWEGEFLPHWKYPPTEADYADLSGAIEEMVRQLFPDSEQLYFYPGFGNSKLAENLKSSFAPHTAVHVVFQNQEVGIIGTVADSVKNYFGIDSTTIKRKIFYAELDIDRFLQLTADAEFKPFSVYPAIRRDLAIVMDREGLEQNVQNILKELPRLSSLLTQVNVTNIYEGKNIPKRKKSVVFSLEFTALDKTLKRTEADDEVSRLVDKLKKKYTFTLR